MEHNNKMDESLLDLNAWLAPVKFFADGDGDAGSQQLKDGSGDQDGDSSGGLADPDGSSGDGTGTGDGSSKSSQTDDSGGDNAPATLEEANAQIDALNIQNKEISAKLGKQGLEMGNLRKVQKSFGRLSRDPAAIVELAEKHGMTVTRKHDGAIDTLLKKADQAEGNVGEIVRSVVELTKLDTKAQIDEIRKEVSASQTVYEDEVVETRMAKSFSKEEREGLDRQADALSALLDSGAMSVTELLYYAARGTGMEDIVKRSVAEGFKKGEEATVKKLGGSVPTGGMKTSMIRKPAGTQVLSEKEGLDQMYPGRYPDKKTGT